MNPPDRDFGGAGTTELGPIQILTVAFDGWRFKGEILPEFERLKNAGVVRIVDLLFVRKDDSGAVATMTASDLDWEEATDFGAMIGGLVGWGAAGEEGAAYGAIAGAAELADGHAFDEQDRSALLESVPNGASAAIALIEHVWARPLRAAIERAHGVEVRNDWLRPDELIALGMAFASAEDDDARDEDAAP